MSFVLCARMPVNSLPAPCAWGLGPCGHHVRLLDSWLLSPYSLTVTSQLEGIIIQFYDEEKKKKTKHTEGKRPPRVNSTALCHRASPGACSVCLLCPNLKDPQKLAVTHLASSHFTLQSVPTPASAPPSPNGVYPFMFTPCFSSSPALRCL